MDRNSFSLHNDNDLTGPADKAENEGTGALNELERLPFVRDLTSTFFHYLTTLQVNSIIRTLTTAFTSHMSERCSAKASNLHIIKNHLPSSSILLR